MNYCYFFRFCFKKGFCLLQIHTEIVKDERLRCWCLLWNTATGVIYGGDGWDRIRHNLMVWERVQRCSFCFSFYSCIWHICRQWLLCSLNELICVRSYLQAYISFYNVLLTISIHFESCQLTGKKHLFYLVHLKALIAPHTPKNWFI